MTEAGRKAGAQLKTCEWPLEDGKGKEIGAPLEPAEGISPANTWF